MSRGHSAQRCGDLAETVKLADRHDVAASTAAGLSMRWAHNDLMVASRQKTIEQEPRGACWCVLFRRRNALKPSEDGKFSRCAGNGAFGRRCQQQKQLIPARMIISHRGGCAGTGWNRQSLAYRAALAVVSTVEVNCAARLASMPT